MPEAEWPLKIRLNPAVLGLNNPIIPPPRYGVSGSNFGRFVELNREVPQQQAQLVNDVFCILNGGEGDYIKYVETFDPEVLDDTLLGPQFRLPLSIDPSLRDVTAQLAEVAGAASAVRTFADHFGGIEYGRVNQALSSGFRVLHRLYLSHLTKIEGTTDEQRSLFSIWVHMEPFAPHLHNAKVLIKRFIDETRLARERKRHHGALDLVERASTSQFVAHDEKEAVIELRGGAVLRSIAELMRREMGNSEASNLYEELLAVASKPYLKMLEKWISEGNIDDPFEEFLIQETLAHNAGSSADNVDDYWDKRYTVRAMGLPLQLSSPEIYNMLLISGKYLNVIRDTDEPKKNGEPQFSLKECRSIEDPGVLDAVLNAYKYANNTLIKVLQNPPLFNLSNLLEKLREIFFLHDNELFDAFVLNSQSELHKPVGPTSQASLEHALALAKDPEEPWNHCIGISLSSEALKDALLSIVVNADLPDNAAQSSSSLTKKDTKLSTSSLLQFDFIVPYPLNVVVSRRSIMRYQFLFRHIVDLKSAHRDLSESWASQVCDVRWQIPKPTGSQANESLTGPNQCIRRACLLRQRMLQLLLDLTHHSLVDGIQHEFIKYMNALSSFDEVSELVEAHIRCLDRSLMNCLLSDSQLLKTSARILSLCRQFAKFLNSNADAIAFFGKTERDTSRKDEDGAEILLKDVLEWFEQTLDRYEQAFDRNIQKFHDQLETFMPNNFVAGASTLYLIQRLKPLLAKRETEPSA